jgi:uncharacterized membrane protein HdeD (DUF308 family)
MSRTDSRKSRRILQNIPFLLAAFRGFAAITLGILLIFIPDKSFPLLANLMGGFWISSGLVLLHKDADLAKLIGMRTSIMMGLVGIITGLLVLTRPLTEQWLDHILVIELLGLVVLLTGILHTWGEIRISRFRRGKRTWGHLALGVFEMILGAMLLFSPLSLGLWTYAAATIWALVGGATILGSAVYDYVYSSAQSQEKTTNRDNE